MTDEQIIKSMAVCADSTKTCEGCHFAEVLGEVNCCHTLIKQALDFINRQKAEIKEIKPYAECRPIGCPLCHRGCFDIDKFCSHCGAKLPAKGGSEG